MLHGNLLGRLGNGLLKFVVLVVMACDVSGAFATTYSEDKTYSEPITIFPTGDVITINPGVTLTINSEVTIMGNLINNGGTIIVGEGGVLTVTGNVTNTSVVSSPSNNKSYSRGGSSCTEAQYNSYSASSGRTKNITTTTTYDSNIKGAINVVNGGKINVNGDFDNNGANLTVSSTTAEKISTVNLKGTFVNETSILLKKETKQQQESHRDGSWKWRADAENSYTDKPIEYLGANINLTNGYLLIDGDMELQDNSTVTFAGTGIGEDIESTICVRKKSDGSGGNMTQSANAVITLASGARGSLVVQGTYTDNTTVQNTNYHPWYLEETKEDRWFFVSYQVVTAINFVTETGFSFNVAKYQNETMANEMNHWLVNVAAALDGNAMTNDEITARINEIQTQLETSGTVDKTALDNLIAQVSELLPIELTSFTATATDYGFAFNWVTASEVENDYFTLEYSIDGVDFNEIDYVHGAGTTSETSEYEYRWDESPEFDVVYFRLKQTDYNGEYSYSDVIAASRKKSSGANGTFRYGPLNLQIQDGELRYIVK